MSIHVAANDNILFFIGWVILHFVYMYQIRSDQSLSHVRLFATPWIAARQASLPITNSRSSLRLASIESVMPSNYLILCHPLFLLPLIFPSIRVFFNESVLCIRWPKYWSFSISPFNEYSGLISFRIDWFDLLAVQGALKNLIQHHSSKASILQCSALFVVQFSHRHVTTEKNILWLCGSLLANWCLCFLIYCLVFSWHFFQGAGIF